MTFDKATYHREYMRRRRAKLPTSRLGRMTAALNDIRTKLEGNDRPLAVELRKIVDEGLA